VRADSSAPPATSSGCQAPRASSASVRARSKELATDFRLLDGKISLEGALRELAESGAWKAIATHRGELTDRAALAARALDLAVHTTDDCYPFARLEASAQKIFDADLALNFGKRLFLGV
jgi:hypothetical protein